MTDIVILGAGYAGVAVAANLAGRIKRPTGVRITVVNPSDRFTERLRLHQVASGQTVADLRLSELLPTVNLVHGWVTAIDPAARTVRIDDDRTLSYDTLVYALGGVADRSVAGVDEHAYTFDGVHDAELFAERLSSLGEGDTVAVCGSGLTGVEAAAEIAEQRPDLAVVLLGRQRPAASFGPKARSHVDGALRRLGVRVRTGVEFVAVLADAVKLADGESVRADAVLWTGGVRVSPLAAAAGLDVDARGRIVVDTVLRSVSHPDVYAVGDAAAIRQPFGVLHGTCQSGMPTGVHAAMSISREVAGKQPRPFRFGYYHAPVSLGRQDAVVQFTRPDHTPRRFALTGRWAVRYKETVSASPWPTFGRMTSMPASASIWPRGGRYTR